MMQFQIRPAAPSDAQLLVGLIAELAAYERAPDAVVAQPERVAEQLARQSPPFWALLAFLNDEPAGYALYYQNYSSWLGLPGLYIEDIWVRPSHRRRGLARKFVQTIAQHAEELGCGRLEWIVMDWNESGLAFFESLGAAPNPGWRSFRWDQRALAEMASAGQVKR